MKNLILSFAVLTSVLTVSCKKETEVKPQNAPGVPKVVTVKYEISNTSGSVVIDYIAPNAQGELDMIHEEVNRNQKTITFSYESGSRYSVTAYNSSPSHDVVQIQVYVDNVLKAEASTTNPSQPAVAQGSF